MLSFFTSQWLLFHLCLYNNNTHCFFLFLQVDIDFEKEPIGVGKDGKDVYFRDIRPSSEEVAEVHNYS